MFPLWISASSFLISITIPFLLDVFLLSFLTPIIVLALNLLDIIAFGLIGYAISNLILDSFQNLYIGLFAGSILWLIIRFIIYSIRHKKKPELAPLLTKISALHLQEEITSIRCTSTADAVNEECNNVSKAIKVDQKKEKRSPLKLIIMTIIVICGIAVPIFLYVFSDEYKPYHYVIMIASVVIAFVSLLALIVPSTKCGANLLFKIESFVMRYGLKILMIVLDTIYLPVLQMFIKVVFPQTVEFPEDNLFVYSY